MVVVCFVLFYTAEWLYSVCLPFRVWSFELRAETLVVHCQDDSTPLINRTFRGHQDWPFICHFVYYPLLNLNETTDGVYHCILAACGISKLFPWPVKTGKTSLKPFVPNFKKKIQIRPATLEKWNFVKTPPNSEQKLKAIRKTTINRGKFATDKFHIYCKKHVFPKQNVPKTL